jgi:hypothetical protein
MTTPMFTNSLSKCLLTNYCVTGRGTGLWRSRGMMWLRDSDMWQASRVEFMDLVSLH